MENEKLEDISVKGLRMVGRYEIGGSEGLKFYFAHKPNVIHRFFCKLFLGWKWIDENNN